MNELINPVQDKEILLHPGLRVNIGKLLIPAVTHILRYFVLTHLVVLGLVVSLPAYGKQPLVSQAVYKAVQNAEKQLEKSAYTKALQGLKAALAETEAGSYNQAVLWKTIGAVYTAQGNYKAAAEAFEKSLAGNALPEQQRVEVHYNLGQVYLVLEQYQKALTTLRPWLEQNQSPTADETLLLVQLYSRLSQNEKALAYAKRLLKITKNPPEKYYQLVIALNFQLKKYAEAVRLLAQLVQRYPDNKRYWQQLVAGYQSLGDYNKVTAVKDLAYRANVMNSPDDILQLSQLYSYSNAPYLGAQLLETEMVKGVLPKSGKNLMLLSDYWLQAREYQKAAKALNSAAKQIDKGQIYQRLGALYFELQDWKNASEAYQTAVRKQGLKNPGNTWLLYGISAHEAKLENVARKAFHKALDYASSRTSAQQWLSIIDSSDS